MTSQQSHPSEPHPSEPRPSEPPPQTHQLYAEYEGTPLWRALASALTELEASGELTVATAPRYVLGFLCRELAAKWVITGDAITRDREPLGRAPTERAPGAGA